MAEMRTFCFVNYYRKLLRNVLLRRYCTGDVNSRVKLEKIRNIGILAHIDAGKTTTTERMLFYSGTIRTMGEVHHGNTVTDYMEQERQRGITITSAAVSFPWRGSQINLIDTPGHIDFTMEVEQSLAVLDGAIVVLDASAGVEAQTLTVWRQAAGYQVPRLLYLNKMDRADASAALCVAAVRDKLQAAPLLLHQPVLYEGRLVGLIDLVTKEEIIWTQGRGQNMTRRKLTEKDGVLWETATESHTRLVDELSSLDDGLAETVIQQESLDNLDSEDIIAAIRRCTLEMKGFPVLCGSSYKNIGVQTLMDGVVAYLPSPLEGNHLYECFEGELSARAFKVQHDDQRGVLTFLRLYSGEIHKGQKIYNLGQEKSEQATMTGDLVTTSAAAAARARARLAAALRGAGGLQRVAAPRARPRLEALATAEQAADLLLGIGTTIPEPVFLCSIEPPSAASQSALETALSELSREDPSLRVVTDEDTGQLVLAGRSPLQAALETALSELSREDPSLRVVTDEDTGQLVLAGMGELHLEIIKERIVREYKIDVELGPLQIAYRETLLGGARRSLAVDRSVGGARQQVAVTLAAAGARALPADQVLRFDKSADSAANLAQLRPRHVAAARQGVATALRHGPRLGCPMVDVQVTLHWLEVGRGTSDSVVTAAVAQCLRKVLEESQAALLEPVMLLQVAAPAALAPRLAADLARRRADVLAAHARAHHNTQIIECIVPLSELLGYSSALRSLSSGLASFTMEFHSYRQMSPLDEEKAIKSVTGF